MEDRNLKKIMLVCSAGMSTSLLVTKMQKAATARSLEVEIFAVSEADSKNYSDVNVVLLGPQVRFLLKKMEANFNPKGIQVQVIDSINYGLMNGDKVLDQALSLIN